LDDVENYVKETGVRGWRKITRNRRRLDVNPERCQGSYMDGRARRMDEVGRHIIKILQYISNAYSYFIKKNATKKVHICKYTYICYLTCPTCCGFLGMKWYSRRWSSGPYRVGDDMWYIC
jgi:hypothetical protein